MKSIIKNTFFLFIIVSSCIACTAVSHSDNKVVPPTNYKKIVVHEDGRMEYRKRLVSNDDVLFYSDGRGGEHAAIKMRTAVQPDYYLAPIDVIRSSNKLDEPVGIIELVE